MKQIYFKKIKGHINPSPSKFYLSCEDRVVEEDDKTVIIKCDRFLEYKRFLIFLKQYVFMQIDSDDKKLEIYMLKSYILCIKHVKGSLLSGHF